MPNGSVPLAARLMGALMVAAVLASPSAARSAGEEGGRGLKSLVNAASAALAPAIEEPEAKLYENEVPLRLSPPPAGKGKPPKEYNLEFSPWDRASQAWAPPTTRTVAAGEDGGVVGVIPAEWFGEPSPDTMRWRMRARTNQEPGIWSPWRVFNARLRTDSSSAGQDSTAPPSPLEDSGGAVPSSPGGDRGKPSHRLHLPKASAEGAAVSGPVPGLQHPERKLYEADVPIQIGPPAGVSPSSYLLEISFYDAAAQNWSEATSQQIEADPDGGLNASLPRSWLEEQAPGAVRWRLRAKTAAPEGSWSEWKMFGRRPASIPKDPPEGQLRSAPTRKP